MTKIAIDFLFRFARAIAEWDCNADAGCFF